MLGRRAFWSFAALILTPRFFGKELSQLVATLPISIRSFRFDSDQSIMATSSEGQICRFDDWLWPHQQSDRCNVHNIRKYLKEPYVHR